MKEVPGMAGETGHLRLFETGHIGHGKAGSFEGYVSGGGIAQYGKGTAKELGKRAAEGDPEALALWNEIGENLGKLLAILIDLFNPEAIVIGSIYARAGEYMKAGMEAVIEKEALPGNVNGLQDPSGRTGREDRRYCGAECCDAYEIKSKMWLQTPDEGAKQLQRE